ncbi:asparaginase [Halostella sp. JP-L12]|uniref:asparaginase domain-containing protein n=1 Tax=Halostella TaxID=1843185 RepID=UPI000EF78DAB|nr:MULTISPECIES: asparaginase domain-containing protein [Halostella]NHN46500.1 asparaginase [Halostella sp. JP-L12]
MTDEYIHFVTTGGTIDKDYVTRRGTRNFTIDDPAVERILESIAPEPNFDYAVESVMKKDSLDTNADDRQKIREACREAPGKNVVVTHGSDTMVETAAELDCEKTIVLTGAAKPQRMTDSDAAFNVGMAVGAVQSLDDGVYVAMSGRVYERDEVEKREDGQFVRK